MTTTTTLKCPVTIEQATDQAGAVTYEQLGADAPAIKCDHCGRAAGEGYCDWIECAGLSPTLPQPSGRADATNMTPDQAREWAWGALKKDLGTEHWTVGDHGTHYGFFLWGWNYRAQYERQRSAAKLQQAKAQEHGGTA